MSRTVARLRRASSVAIAAILVSACLGLAACGGESGGRPRAPSRSGARPAPEPTSPPPGTQEGASDGAAKPGPGLGEGQPVPGPADAKPAKPPVAMKPAADPEAKKTAKPADAKAADSLTGHDRNLVRRTFDAIYASDFEIGPLAGPDLPPALAHGANALLSAILARSLDEAPFSGEAAAVAAVTLGPGLAELPEGTLARLGKPIYMPGGQVAFPIRLVGAASGGLPDPRRSALGLAVFSAPDGEDARLDHLELDLGSFAAERSRDEPWDPYADAR